MIKKIDGLFTPEEVTLIKESIHNAESENDQELGRIKKQLDTLPPKVEKKIVRLSQKYFGLDLDFANATYVEYNNKFGQPNLPAHFDHDDKDLVFDYQWEANTSWDLGVGTEVYPLVNNSAIVFNANKHIHWRPHKTFKDDQYVRMIFFRLYNKANPSDYSHLDYRVGEDIFKEVEEFRNKIGETND
jgi:hypothetical protein